MPKKAVAVNYLVVLVLAVLVLIVMLMFERSVGEAAKLESIKTKCKASVYAHSAAHIKGIDLSSSINCPTQNLTVPDGTQDEQKLYIAKRMTDCWDMFGKGGLDLFDRDGIYCVICSQLDFEGDEPIQNLEQYLYMTKMPAQEMKFMDFLNGYKTPRADEAIGDITKQIIQQGQAESLDPSKSYSVIFVYARGTENIRNALELTANMGSTQGTPFMIAGGVIAIVGGTAASFTGLGSIVGVPMMIAGKVLFIGGGVESAIESYLTTDVAPEHIAYVALREHSKDELQQLGCRYLPARQRK
jgi:hypothetical protein